MGTDKYKAKPYQRYDDPDETKLRVTGKRLSGFGSLLVLGIKAAMVSFKVGFCGR